MKTIGSLRLNKIPYAYLKFIELYFHLIEIDYPYEVYQYNSTYIIQFKHRLSVETSISILEDDGFKVIHHIENDISMIQVILTMDDFNRLGGFSNMIKPFKIDFL